MKMLLPPLAPKRFPICSECESAFVTPGALANHTRWKHPTIPPDLRRERQRNTQRRRYQENRERLIILAREWHRANPECQRLADARWRKKDPPRTRRMSAERNLRHTLRSLGLSQAEWEWLLSEHGGRCAICRRLPRRGRLSLDHSHLTGSVRGLLCRPCNARLGHWRDSVEWFERAFKYLSGEPIWLVPFSESAEENR